MNDDIYSLDKLLLNDKNELTSFGALIILFTALSFISAFLKKKESLSQGRNIKHEK